MKTILITGVGKGFGRALLEYFSKEYFVIGVTRSKDDIDNIQNDESLKSHHYELIEADVTDFDTLNNLVSRSLDNRSDSIYGLINNAGVRCRKPLLELSIDDIRRVIESNLLSAINLTQVLIPYFIHNGKGRIINVSSILSQQSLPDLSAYSVSKGGLDSFTRSVAVEFGSKQITCNSILPGFCKTSYYENFRRNDELYSMTLSKTPLGRWGEVNELTGVCDLLLSDSGAYINGASIPIDGGWLA